LRESIALYLRADVPVAAYVSGGIGRRLIAIRAAGRESSTASACTANSQNSQVMTKAAMRSRLAFELHQIAIIAQDFHDSIEKPINHLDHPVAGPGAFGQYMVSGLTSEHVKVVLGWRGGGNARYLIADCEQCIAAAIDETYKKGNLVVAAGWITLRLTVLQEYKPLLRRFFASGMFGPLGPCHFRLIDRFHRHGERGRLVISNRRGVFECLSAIFNSEANREEGSAIGRARDKLGFLAQVGREEGLRSTIGWTRETSPRSYAA
jgi:asparagine synthase (glutamine-hydrolysing)